MGRLNQRERTVSYYNHAPDEARGYSVYSISKRMKYMLIAGEASGDLHASNVIKSLREIDRDADIRFFGGDLMAKEARRNPDLHYDMMNVMGFSEVLRKLPQIFRNLRRAKKLLREFRPDALVLVD